MTTSNKTESGNQVDNPNATVTAPNNATTTSSTRPGRFQMLSRPPSDAIATAPIDCDARNTPKPNEPTCSTSFAITGNSCVTPANSTANMSSVSAGNSSGERKINRSPTRQSLRADAAVVSAMNRGAGSVR